MFIISAAKAVVVFGIIGTTASAYETVMTTGEIKPVGEYTLTPELQFLSDPSGVDVAAHLELPIDEGSAFRAEAGVGTTDMFLGAYFKFIPFPDVEGQPAVGLNSGLNYAADAGLSTFTARFEPIVSKKLSTGFGYLLPYGSLPVGIKHRTSGNDRNDVAFQVAAGMEIMINSWKGLRLMPEFGINLDNSTNYISIAAVLDFDNEGFHLSFE